MTRKVSRIDNEYPRIFWIVIAIAFIDRIGGALLFPFFALYITSKFISLYRVRHKQQIELVTMTEVMAL